MKSVFCLIFIAFSLLTAVLSASAQTETATDSTTTTTNSTTTTSVTTLPPPDATVSGTVTVTEKAGTSSPVALTDEQREKIRLMLKAQQANEAQRKRQAELLDKTPVLEDKVNPGLTEKQSIPKRF